MSPYKRYLLFLCFFCSACSHQGSWNIFSDYKPLTSVDWTAEELEADYAIHDLRETKEASFHIVRLKGSEKPHIHATHDLTVVLLKGEARVDFGGRVVEMRKGDIVEIPMGTTHWAENARAQASEAYVIFTPPFDGKDIVPVETFNQQ